MSEEIPLRKKYRTGGTGRNKARTSNNRPARPKTIKLKGEMEAAQTATKAHQMVKWLDFATTGNGKIRWITQSEYDRLHGPS